MGDIHGRADLLAAMLDLLETRAESEKRGAGEPIVIFLGDYVDRGPHSSAVIEMLLEGRPRGFERRFLKGNHEAAMLGFLEEPLANRAWVFQGGSETLKSYGVQPPALGSPDKTWIEASEKLRTNLPEKHLAFLQKLERYITFGDYAFVHAGVDPALRMDEQSDADLFWARERFIASRRRFPYRVVHGHTPVSEPYADHRRIAVDTGAYASGALTAVRLEEESVTFLGVADKPARR